MNYLSLFSGVGGLDLGLDRAGMTCVGQVELDATCRSVLDRHWPGVPKHDDVRTAPAWWYSRPRPPVRLVAGGYPCQPFSRSGAGRGMADERWGWPWFRAAVRAVRPQYVLVENVSALLDDADAFGWMLGDLAEDGFDADWTVLSACAVGAPHARERLFVVAHAHGVDGPQGVGRDQHPGLSVRPANGEPPSWADPLIGALEAQRRPDGVANGLAARMVAAGGNAVVPRVAEHIGRLIMAHAAVPA